jgi:hypothetical protein
MRTKICQIFRGKLGRSCRSWQDQDPRAYKTKQWGGSLGFDLHFFFINV